MGFLRLMNSKSIHLKIFKKLLDQHGPRNWWPAKTRFEVIVGAVLTQNVSWRNAKKAILNLKKTGLLSPGAIISASHKKIADKIRSSRFYNQKAHKLKAFSTFLIEEYDGSLDKMFNEEMKELRSQLLGIRGIGEETADCILLYAGKKLSFVSDAYTKRFLQRYGLLNDMKTYREIRKSFMESLPEDIYLYNEYHALIDHHGSGICQSKPDCQNCSVRVIDKRTRCQYGNSNGD